MLARLALMVFGLEAAALAVGLWGFGWPALLVGAPVLVLTMVAMIVIWLSERPRRLLEQRRATRWDPDAALPGGLMSGFFERPGPRS